MNALRLSTRLAPRAFGFVRSAQQKTSFSKCLIRWLYDGVESARKQEEIIEIIAAADSMCHLRCFSDEVTDRQLICTFLPCDE